MRYPGEYGLYSSKAAGDGDLGHSGFALLHGSPGDSGSYSLLEVESLLVSSSWVFSSPNRRRRGW